MNAVNLKESGFSEPCPLKAISFSSLPSMSQNNGVVFAIIDPTLTGKQISDILYIGRTKNPARRILGGYLGGYGGKNTKKISAKIFNNGCIDKASLSWMLTDKPRIVQRELLDKFAADHDQFPIWNSPQKKRLKTIKKASIAAKPKKPNSTTSKISKPVSQSKSTSQTKPKNSTKPSEPNIPAVGPASSAGSSSPQRIDKLKKS
jgi:hypothetical protein